MSASKLQIPDIGNLPADALLTRHQTAAVTGYSYAAMRKWAAEGRGPRFIKVEGRPRYRAEDVRNWMGLAAGSPSGIFG